MAELSIKTRSIITSLYLRSHTPTDIANRLNLNVESFFSQVKCECHKNFWCVNYR